MNLDRIFVPYKVTYYTLYKNGVIPGEIRESLEDFWLSPEEKSIRCEVSYWPNGTWERIWTNSEGKYHKISGPAVELNSGYCQHWINGKLHRLDGPAVYNVTRSFFEYYENNKFHRLDGPARIIRRPPTPEHDIEQWFCEGKFHRMDGPARIAQNGSVEYYIHGVKQSGPPVER